MTIQLKPKLTIVAALFAVIPVASFAQQNISQELETLDAELVSASAKSLPADWTGGLEGLSLVFELSSPLPAELDELSDAHHDAARAICRKIGISAVQKNRVKPGLETLRFVVVELKATKSAFGPLNTVKVKGLVFDADNDCIELR